VQAELLSVKGRLEELLSQLAAVGGKASQESEECRAVIAAEALENQKLMAQAEELEHEIAELEAQQEQTKVEREILMSKKVTLTDQLQKSWREKVTEITRARNNSPYVRRLIEQQQQNWVERQKLYESYSEVAEEHEAITKIVARKALIARELGSALAHVPGGPDAMTSLNAAYCAIQAENRRLAGDLQELHKELELTEFDSIDVKRQLASLH
jgi:uncharacterized protein YdcH (DUF465 family)